MFFILTLDSDNRGSVAAPGGGDGHRHTTRLSPRLLIAYRLTTYEAAGATVRPGRRSAAFDEVLLRHHSRTATFISADNPHSRRMPSGWNHRMRQSLHAAARRLRVMPARGVLRGWEEAHLLVLGDPRPAIRLARRYRQNAVVIVRRHESASIADITLSPPDQSSTLICRALLQPPRSGRAWVAGSTHSYHCPYIHLTAGSLCRSANLKLWIASLMTARSAPLRPCRNSYRLPSTSMTCRQAASSANAWSSRASCKRGVPR